MNRPIDILTYSVHGRVKHDVVIALGGGRYMAMPLLEAITFIAAIVITGLALWVIVARLGRRRRN